jgi:hypothetical protein
LGELAKGGTMRKPIVAAGAVAVVVLASSGTAMAGGMPGTEASPGLAAGLALGVVVLLGLLVWGAFRVGAPPGGRERPKR